jgi:multidrug resistance efflux pump
MAWTSSDLAAIEKAIASGELSVQFAERRMQYRSIDELLKARVVIKEELAQAGTSVASVRSTYATFTKD